MTVLTFPSNPTEGQVYNAPNSIRYVFDGVKWVVETVASTSEAVTNSVQDRVAPMFVNGDNSGITFTYDAVTNTISASVTSDNSDRLVSGEASVVLGSNGDFTIPGVIKSTGGTSYIDPGDSHVVLQSSSGITWTFDPDGVLTTPNGGRLASAGMGWLGIDNGATGTPISINNYVGGEIGTIATSVFLTSDYVNITASTNTWAFGTDGILQLPSAGAVQQNYSFTKTTNANVSLGASAVVWTGSYDYISGAKLIIQVECNETGDTTGWHSQTCEAIIASRGYANSYGGPGGDPQMSVYGVVHTSVDTLVTFTVQRNPTTKLIEVVGTTTAAANGTANLRIHSVEMATTD